MLNLKALLVLVIVAGIIVFTGSGLIGTAEIGGIPAGDGCINYCEKGDKRCGGEGGNWLAPCGDENLDGCYEWMSQDYWEPSYPDQPCPGGCIDPPNLFGMINPAYCSGDGPPQKVCGDGICSPENGETSDNCPSDCFMTPEYECLLYCGGNNVIFDAYCSWACILGGYDTDTVLSISEIGESIGSVLAPGFEWVGIVLLSFILILVIVILAAAILYMIPFTRAIGMLLFTMPGITMMVIVALIFTIILMFI